MCALRASEDKNTSGSNNSHLVGLTKDMLKYSFNLLRNDLSFPAQEDKKLKDHLEEKTECRISFKRFTSISGTG